jgi:CheY-like chemotaxis protein
MPTPEFGAAHSYHVISTITALSLCCRVTGFAAIVGHSLSACTSGLFGVSCDYVRQGMDRRGGRDVYEASGATVLLVDDNTELLDLLARALRHIGHFTVVQAENGAAGLEMALATHPACIVIDVMMPGLDGYQLVRALRGDRASAEISIVMLTALVQDENRLGGLLAGADQYLVKPVKIQDLIPAIAEAVALSGEERLRRMRELSGADGPDGSESTGWEGIR